MRLTRDADSIWLLEFPDNIDQEVFQRIWAGEINNVLNLLEKTKAQKLVIDLTTIQDFGSRDLQLLIMLYKQVAQQNMQIVLRNPSPYLSQVLRLMQFDHMLKGEFDENYIEMK